MGLRSNSLIV